MEVHRSSKFCLTFLLCRFTKPHEFEMILSATTLTLSCGSDGMGRDMLLVMLFPRGCFVEVKEFCPHTSLKKQIASIKHL